MPLRGLMLTRYGTSYPDWSMAYMENAESFPPEKREARRMRLLGAQVKLTYLHARA
jgi:hypothetical protein